MFLRNLQLANGWPRCLGIALLARSQQKSQRPLADIRTSARLKPWQTTARR